MTSLTRNQNMPVRRSACAGGTTERRGPALWLMAWWQLMMATSQVAVDRGYASPWKRDADRSPATRTQTRG